MTALNLEISGMHCGACVRRVTAALEKIQGVQVGAVEVGSARVEYDPSLTDVATITAAVGKIGFSAAAAK
jgi:copper chaperone